MTHSHFSPHHRMHSTLDDNANISCVIRCSSPEDDARKVYVDHCTCSTISGATSTTAESAVRSTLCVPVRLLQAWALLLHDSWSLNWRRITGEELLESGTLRLLQNSLATVGCTIIWDFSAARQKVTSYVRFTTV